MALAELNAFEQAYQALHGLSEPGRRRALQWLSDVLNDTKPARTTDSPANDVPAMHAAPARRRRRAKADEKPAPAKRGRKPRSAAAEPAAPAARRRRQPAQKATPGGRIYRRMPDPDEIMSIYAQVGTIAGVAEQLNVPAYTVTGWARRLRGLGYQIGRV